MRGSRGNGSKTQLRRLARGRPPRRWGLCGTIWTGAMMTCLSVIAGGGGASGADDAGRLALVAAGAPVGVIVIMADQAPPLLLQRAAATIAETAERWSGARVPVVHCRPGVDALPPSPALVLGITASLQRHCPAAIARHPWLNRAAFLDAHGYACAPLELDQATRCVIASPSARGVYNGAVYAQEFLLDGAADHVWLRAEETARTPVLQGRPVYLLTIWGNEDEYRPEDWMYVLDRLARDGATGVYFWLSGHFPSRRFPQTYRSRNGEPEWGWDATEQTRIGTVEDQRRIMTHCRELGMEFFIGGGLGGWVGSYLATNQDPATLRTAARDEQGNDVSKFALCPAHPQSRAALIGHYVEMFAALPEADGLYMESADELGACHCEACSRTVDAHGSRAFGQYQLSLVREMMHEIWKINPRAKLAYTIGYKPHAADRAYYAAIQQMSGDPRIEWMEARKSWTFPAADGEPLPAVYFGNKMMKWIYPETAPLEMIVETGRRLGREGWHGYVMNFSPGSKSGSFYHDIPLPMDLLPWSLTYFVFREIAWEPSLDGEEIQERIGRRFFGAEAPAELAHDLCALRELIREGVQKWSAEKSRLLAQIEQRIRAARAGASAKRNDGLDLMQRAVDDIKKHVIAAHGEANGLLSAEP